MARRRLGKQRLAADLRRLRLECIPYFGATHDLFYPLMTQLESPDLPEISVVFQPQLLAEERLYLLNQQHRCIPGLGGLGGREPCTEDSPCTWCLLKEESGRHALVAQYNGQIRHFLTCLEALDTESRDHFSDEDRGSNPTVATGYDMKKTLLERAAKAWMHAHPPPPEFAWGSASEVPVWPDFCESRLLHQKCENIDCFDCQGHIWLSYIEEGITWASEVACFEQRLSALTRPDQDTVGFFSNIDEEAQTPGFLFYGPRKRVIMREFLAWAKENPPPTLEEIREGYAAGPGNEESIHGFCLFHRCFDEYCTGIH